MRSATRELEASLRSFTQRLERTPACILIVSAHWETRHPTVNASVAPSLLFDYAGFPSYTYELTYSAPGDPSVAARVGELLDDAGIANEVDSERGWDHGVFVPLKVMFPDADIPVVQLSMQVGLDPEAHLAIGQALRPLRSEGVLIVGSGQSYHNLGALMKDDPTVVDTPASAFDQWLRDAVTDTDNREQSLIDWSLAPGARWAQPREDHLLPLMVVAGAASGEAAHIDFRGRSFGKPISGFRFGSTPNQGDFQ